jgi:hypothetical protein
MVKRSVFCVKGLCLLKQLRGNSRVKAKSAKLSTRFALRDVLYRKVLAKRPSANAAALWAAGRKRLRQWFAAFRLRWRRAA